MKKVDITHSEWAVILGCLNDASGFPYEEYETGVKENNGNFISLRKKLYKDKSIRIEDISLVLLALRQTYKHMCQYELYSIHNYDTLEQVGDLIEKLKKQSPEYSEEDNQEQKYIIIDEIALSERDRTIIQECLKMKFGYEHDEEKHDMLFKTWEKMYKTKKVEKSDIPLAILSLDDAYKTGYRIFLGEKKEEEVSQEEKKCLIKKLKEIQ